MPLILLLTPLRARKTSCPNLKTPSISVPVTTVPNPEMLKERSIARRGLPRSGRSSNSPKAESSSPINSLSPSLVVDETQSTGELSSFVPLTASSTSSFTNSNKSLSTRSDLVMTTKLLRTLSKSRIAKCSKVWGITDSSAATINMAKSIAPTPDNIFFIKRSCPGTSTMLTSLPLGRFNHAKPKSIVNPRSFSSRKRSGSMPVRASMSVDLP